jgi:putative addiction module component (TIGR02574 family)
MSTGNEQASFGGLSFAERLILVQDLWDSIAAEQQGFELSPERKAELSRRLAAYRADGNPGSPWEDVKARILAKL